MGLTVLTVEVGNPSDPDKLEAVEFLIDSGAIYSVIPREVLERLGVKPHSTQEFRLADGSKVERELGVAFFRYGDRAGGRRRGVRRGRRQRAARCVLVGGDGVRSGSAEA